MTILKVDTVSGIGTEGTVFEGDITFDSLNYMTLPKGTTTQSNRGRGMVLGGIHPEVTRMETYSLISSSNGVEFGSLGSAAIAWGGATGNATRSVVAGGDGVINTIEYVQVVTLGNAADFGDLTVARRHTGPAGNNTRGIFAGGETAGSNTITNVMDYITIATTGNAADFGDQAVGSRGAGGCGSPTRAIWGGGQTGPTGIDVIDYATFATTGNATDFGDLFQAVYSVRGCSASHTRGMWNGGYTTGYINIIQYVTIATTGNGADWGDMANAKGGYNCTTSDCHGGLSE